MSDNKQSLTTLSGVGPCVGHYCRSFSESNLPGLLSSSERTWIRPKSASCIETSTGATRGGGDMSEPSDAQRSEAQVREDIKLMSQERFDAKREEYLDAQAAMRQKYVFARIDSKLCHGAARFFLKCQRYDRWMFSCSNLSMLLSYDICGNSCFSWLNVYEPEQRCAQTSRRYVVS